MKSGFLEGFFCETLKEIDKYGLATIALFCSGKGKITALSSESIKRISEKLKNIQRCRSAILEIRNIPDLFRNLLENNYEKERNGLILRNSFA